MKVVGIIAEYNPFNNVFFEVQFYENSRNYCRIQSFSQGA